jgi:phosphomevalonate kinase
VDLLRIPVAGLHLTYAFTGESASTPKLIGKAEQRLDPEQRAAFTARSDSLGDALEDGLRLGRFAQVRESVVGLRALLGTLGPLETEGTQRILALGELYGAVGKISGAGGGDGVILFSPDAASQAQLIEGLSARGFLALPIQPEPGLRGEGALDPELSRWIDA